MAIALHHDHAALTLMMSVDEMVTKYYYIVKKVKNIVHLILTFKERHLHREIKLTLLKMYDRVRI